MAMMFHSNSNLVDLLIQQQQYDTEANVERVQGSNQQPTQRNQPQAISFSAGSAASSSMSSATYRGSADGSTFNSAV